MKLTFLGAAREVTGSRYLLHAAGLHLMIDYGMEQGVDVYENAPLPIAASQIDAVLLTHAHIDHSGWLPKLYKQGFRGDVYMTRATANLARIMLLDSANIQESDAEWRSRKNQRSGKPPVEPEYTVEDAQAICGLFRPHGYNEQVQISEDISFTMVDAGHLLGSASFILQVKENGESRTLVFSGDIGNTNQPLLRDPCYPKEADIVVMESTYGNRCHGETPDYIAHLTRVLQETFDRGGNVVIPSFAVGRTQEMLYFIRQIKNEGLIHGHDHFPVYVDSPLGIEATKVFDENAWECADEETRELLQKGVNPLTFEDLHIAASAEESKQINNIETPKVIISASGMCDAGRVRHHLKHNLWRSESTILFVGYQSNGTLGRALVDGAKEVRLFDETITVQAQMEFLNGISGHADQKGLMAWIDAFEKKPARVFVTHGDEESAECLAAMIRERGLEVTVPYNGEEWELLAPTQRTREGQQQRIKKKTTADRKVDEQKQSAPKTAGKAQEEPTSREYAQLVEVGNQIAGLIQSMRTRGVKHQKRLTKMLSAVLHVFNQKSKR